LGRKWYSFEVAIMIGLENVKKTINGKEVLREITITVRPGEIYAYLGHNGAGKTPLSASSSAFSSGLL